MKTRAFLWALPPLQLSSLLLLKGGPEPKVQSQNKISQKEEMGLNLFFSSISAAVGLGVWARPGSRTSAQTHTSQQQRDLVLPQAACPGIWAQPTEVEQGLPYFLSCPAFTSRPQSPQAGTQTQPCTWLRPPCQPSELGSGRIVAAVIRIVQRCSAATNKTKTWILNSPSAWMPFAPGFRAGAASSIQEVKDAEDSHSTWRCGQATGRGRRCWLRVWTAWGQGSQHGLYHGLGGQQTSCSDFSSDFWLREINPSPLKAKLTIAAPGQTPCCHWCKCFAP